MNLNVKFLKYHQENPQVYEWFKIYTLQAIKAGWVKFGSSAVAERVRWETNIRTQGEGYKINNSYRAFYARLFIEEHPHYKNFFRLRRSQADQKVFF